MCALPYAAQPCCRHGLEHDSIHDVVCVQVEQHGFGIWLKPQALDPANPDVVHAAVRSLLEEPQYKVHTDGAA